MSICYKKFNQGLYDFFLLKKRYIHLSFESSKLHKITFKSPNLYPESLTYDPKSQHFLIGSLSSPTISSVSDANVIETLIHDSTLPENASFLGVTLHPRRRILFAAVNHLTLSALAASTRRRIFLAYLPDPDVTSIANDVAADFNGNAYVTNSAGNFIWKVNASGDATVLSNSKLFTQFENRGDHDSGLNGIVYVSRGFLLVVHSNSGKLFKVDVDDGRAKEVFVEESLVDADGIAMRRDGVLVVVSSKRVWFLKSDDSWGRGVVYDSKAIEEAEFASSVAVKDERRVYVLYGHIDKFVKGSLGREVFGIEEVRSEREEKEEEDENVWIYVLVGLGLAYFLVWRFQMKRLITNMDRKVRRVRHNFGPGKPNSKRALSGAITFGVSYTLGGLVPLIPYIFIPTARNAVIASAVVTLLVLLVFGFAKGRHIKVNPFISAVQTALTGVIAAAAAFGLGNALQG